VVFYRGQRCECTACYTDFDTELAWKISIFLNLLTSYDSDNYMPGSQFVFVTYLTHSDTNNWENRINSLTTTAGEWMPRKGTMSTCRKFSTADPTVAPAASPPTVINAAFPAQRTTKVFMTFQI
jgi:hypothetical protein